MNTLLIEEKFQLQIKEKVSIRPSVSVFQGIYKDNYVAIKIYDEHSTFIRETDSISRLYDKGVEVPQIINEGNINDSTYIMIQEWWNGIPLKERVKDLDRHTYKKILFDVGKLLAKVHFSLPYDELKEAVFWRRLEFNKFEDFTWNTYLNSLVDKWVANIRLNDKDKSIKLQEYLQFIHQHLYFG
ncbi:hypothetical protein [Bacillus alkalicellulosilyticus]|uniref:hypothetical protein n=1 Tax=Alkalihalobacterium alkalicellulosilyticum TaxID=1912214 RepID=UPI0009983369|nr:hypothetical protein [Bacillus alkalicellulosilyticus]